MVLSIGISGISGKMGQALCELISKDPSLELIGGVRRTTENGPDNFKSNLLTLVEKADILIDFSSFEILEELLFAVEKYSKPIVIGTTGLLPSHLDLLKKCAKQVAILYSPNFSPGVALCKKIIKMAPQALKDYFKISILETHHKKKKDKPSGTALMLKEIIEKDRNISVPIRSIRRGEVVGKHKIIYTSDEEKLEINHEAFSRNTFAKGALIAAKFLVAKKPGLYSIEDIF